MPRLNVVRIDLYDLILFGPGSKLYLSDVANALLRIMTRLGTRGRYINQFQIPFTDIPSTIEFIYKKCIHILDNKDQLLNNLYSEVVFLYRCMLSTVKSRRKELYDWNDVVSSFDHIVDDIVLDVSKKELLICKEYIYSINVDELLEEYYNRYNEDDIYYSDSNDETEDDYVTLDQLKSQLEQHKIRGKTTDIESKLDDINRRQDMISKKILPKIVKDYLICSCGAKYTKSNYSHHKRTNKQHIDWISSHGGLES